MSVCVLIQPGADAAGGGDITPGAVDWTNVSGGFTGIEETNAVTFSGLSSPIVVKANWTSTSSNPIIVAPIKNGVDGGYSTQATGAAVTIINGNMLAWRLNGAYTDPSGNLDTGTVRVTNESRTATVTVTIASPGVVTWTGHGFSANDMVLFRTTGALPTGLTAETVYHVIAAGLTADEFQVSATQGGSAINTSGSQSGVHTGVSVLDTFTFTVRYVPGAPP